MSNAFAVVANLAPSESKDYNNQYNNTLLRITSGGTYASTIQNYTGGSPVAFCGTIEVMMGAGDRVTVVAGGGGAFLSAHEDFTPQHG